MKLGKLLSLIFLGVGFLMLIQVSLPIIKFKILELSLARENLPLSSPQTAQVLGVSITSKDNFPYFVSNIKRNSPPPYQEFSLSIPSLKIKEEKVLVDSNDLSEGLAHLPGSALPGEKGNVFISGHSALPILFTKKTSDVFGSLLDIKKDDVISLNVLGTQFSYKVTSIRIVSPSDTSVILPPDSRERYITLMTCVPPGLNTKRLIVLGKLI